MSVLPQPLDESIQRLHLLFLYLHLLLQVTTNPL